MAMKKFQMLNLICESCILTSKEKLVAQYFIYKSNKSGECYPSVNTIAKHCGVSERTVQRATKKLQEQNYITIEKRIYKGRQTSNEYKFNIDMIEETSKKEMDDKSVNSMPELGAVNMSFILFEDSILLMEAEVYGDNYENDLNGHYDDSQVSVENETNDTSLEPCGSNSEECWLDYDTIDGNMNYYWNQEEQMGEVYENYTYKESFDIKVLKSKVNVCREDIIRLTIYFVTDNYQSKINFYIIFYISNLRINIMILLKKYMYYKISFVEFKIRKRFFMPFLGVP